MKTTTLFAILLCLLNQKISAQAHILATRFYNYDSSLSFTKNDEAEAVIMDSSFNVYVAGEVAKETNYQDIRILKYYHNGDSIIGKYENNLYKEYVKKVLFINNTLFVIGNAINTSTNKPTLFILKYSSNLKLLDYSFYTGHSFYAPEDVTNDNTGNLYVACYSANNNSNSLAVVKITRSNLHFQDSVIYYYQSNSDKYVEIPKKIIYEPKENYVYVAGGVSDTINNMSTTLLIKFAVGLEYSWTKVPSLKTGNNIFNSVYAAGGKLYAAGVISDLFALKVCNYSGSGNKTFQYDDPATDSKQEALKIIGGSENSAQVAGYAKSIKANRYTILIINYSKFTQSLSIIAQKSLPYNSAMKDAAGFDGNIYVAGWKSSGNNKNIFLYEFDSENGSVIYSNTVANRSSAANAIGGMAIFENNYAGVGIAIAGYVDTVTTNPLLQINHKFFIRVYDASRPTFAKVGGYTNDALKNSERNADFALSQNIPNPFQNTTTINYTLPQAYTSAQIIITNKSGTVIKSINISGAGKGSINVDASGFLSGVYYYALYINNKLINTKQMVVLK